MDILLFGGYMPDLLFAAIVSIAGLGISHPAVFVKLAGVGGPTNLHYALSVEVDLYINDTFLVRTSNPHSSIRVNDRWSTTVESTTHSPIFSYSSHSM